MRVFIFVHGAPLFEGDEEGSEETLVGRNTEIIRDTTRKRGGLPVYWEGEVHGFAMRMKRVMSEGEPIIEYAVDIYMPVSMLLNGVPFDDGYRGRVEGVMWLTGLYPTRLIITSMREES